MWKIIVLSLIPGIILIIQNGIHLHKSSEYLEGRHIMKSNVAFSLEVGDVIHTMQKERGLFALYVSVNGGNTMETKLLEAFNHTDNSLENLSRWIANNNLTKVTTKQLYHRTLREFRKKRDNVTFEDVVSYYVEHINTLIVWMVDVVKEENNSNIWADLVAYHMLIHGKENFGIERAVGAYFFARGELDQEMLLMYKGQHEQAKHFLDQVKGYSTVATLLLNSHLDNDTNTLIQCLRNTVMANTADTFSTAMGLMWFGNMTVYINSLQDVTRAMADYIKMKTDEEILTHKVTVSIDVIILVVTFIVAVLVTFFIYKISKNIEKIKNHLQEKTIHLEKERQRTESLLTHLVPAKIAKRMRTDLVEPESFASVTVMFADISNMDTFICRCTPNEFLEMINDVLEVTDFSLAKHNVTRIASTGNALMVASGLHQKNSRNHSDDIANLSIDVMGKVYQIQMKQAFNERVKLRIGISAGPVVAGVIGRELPKYCVFGKSVTEAYQLMDTCLPSYIQLSESVYKNITPRMFTTRIRDDLSRKTAHSSKETYWLCGSVTSSLAHINLDVQSIEDVGNTYV